ncbi:MAG: spermidine synthase [Burkholderiales bacterium]|nr:spermidine synthase [Burkholderiales bacterium]
MNDDEEELPEATISESDGVRFLHLGSIWVQGAMRIRKPQQVELVYIQRMLASLLWLPSDEIGQGRALQLGLGAGAITRFTHKALHMPTTVVEINPRVVEVGRHWFHLPAEVEVVLADAGAWLDAAEPQSIRLLHVDLYDQDAAAPVLDDEAFYAACHRVLDDGGVMSVNLFGRDASFERSAERIAAVFGPDRVWSIQPTREGNTAVIAARGAALPRRDELAARAASIETRFGSLGLAARKWPRMIRPWAEPGDDTA